MKWKRISLAVALVAGLTVAGVGASAAQAPPSCTAGTTVQVKDGPVCGLTADGITSYLDIPYAAPPVGALRWQSPQPHAPWTTVLSATTAAPECPSPGFPPGSPPAAGTSEDCLYLKIEAPAGAKPGDNLPVMYEVHGGGFLGTALTNDGDNLVRGGKVVYVFVNYRLGILGFLADQALGPHSGDYGLQDQQAGLRWVQDNIASFGGNPGNVTVFGESAGGASTCDQVASPTARGLFQHAISVSGFYNYQDNIVWSKVDCKSAYFTEAQAQQAGAQFAAKVGCGHVASVAACLRNVPVAELVEAGGQFIEPTAGGTIGPIVNGTTLTMSPAQAFATGHVNHVQLISDVGRDEFNGGVYANAPGLPVVVASTAAQYQQLVQEQFGRLAPAVERLYPLSQYQSPYTAYRTIMADSASVCPMLQASQELSRYIPVYVDIDADADNPAGEDLQLPLGAQHSGTNGLVHFPTAQLDPNQAALQTQLLDEWTHFAQTGNPSAPQTPAWAPYSGRQHPVMLLQPADTSIVTPAASIAAQHNCAFWNQVTHY
ncbi:MAG TPA: carboxylesterase family protein [Trebonia sp.]|nr:carboxylesterase family protein [Trebonia sp.]